ncbi:hypothetical protein M407DRAFT_29378 [Tulasnella calospora MUT 4182]|uniref:F-box domain-containing protein n=1 Tax=Tulasnella calospora MUT 4182 TaxID=1051891 RepID=A0A0C3PZK6_9AGAM|nr:hypothetical protein M407DRAFT_29378 [Tulasnella calospora MUT 4182]
MNAAAGSNMTKLTKKPGTPAPCINDILPAETLCTIFLAIYRGKPAPFPPSEAQPLNQFHHELLNLMLVCRAWQSLINKSPHLWTRLWVGRGMKSLWTSGSKVPNSDGQEWLEAVRDRLKKSGELPLEVTVLPDRIVDIAKTATAIDSTVHRWERLDISYGHHELLLPLARRVPTSASDIQKLLNYPMPVLESLHLGPILEEGVSGIPYTFLIDVNLPSLSRLSCRKHLLLTTSAHLLTTITLHGIDTDSLNLQRLSKPIMFPSLVELRAIRCPNILELLTIFLAPKLRKLVNGPNDGDVDDDWGESPLHEFPTLPSYENLLELQWGDSESDLDVLTYILSRCPNLLRFSNYVHGFEGVANQDHYVSYLPAHLISRDASLDSDPLCSRLEEVCFDLANPWQVEELAKARPSIKRVRFLNDPSTIYRGMQDPVERSEWEHPFGRLREKVDVAVGMDSWH